MPTDTPLLPEPADARRWRRARRSAAFLAMLAVAMIYRAPVPTDWDAWDYSAQAVMGHSSDLLLGRWWFLATMRLAYLSARAALALPAEEAFTAMQAASALMMGAAVVAGMAWTRRLTRSDAAEVIFAASAISGPMLGIYAPAVMTEPMTLLALSLAFWAWQRAIDAPGGSLRWALAGGLAFGVAIDIREQAVLLALWPAVTCLALRPPRRWRLLAAAAGGAGATLAIGVLGAWAWYPWPEGYWHNMARWTHSMTAERGTFAVSLAGNLAFAGAYSLIVSPAVALALAALPWAIARRRREGWLALGAAGYFATLLANHDLGVNPRFAIPLVWMLLPLAAGALAAVAVDRGRRYRLRLGAAVLGVAGINVAAVAAGHDDLRRYYFDDCDRKGALHQALLRLPDDAVVVAGAGTPIAFHLNRTRRVRFDVVASGWSWPRGKLGDLVAQRLAEGKSVYVNLHPDDWRMAARDSGEWGELCDVADRYELSRGPGTLVRLLPPAATAASPAR